MKLDFQRLIGKYGGKWVAFNEDSSRVLVSGKKAEKVYEDMQQRGVKVPKLFRVPNKYQPYIG